MSADRPAGRIVDYTLIGLLTMLVIVVVLVFLHDQVATVLAWITSLIG